MISKWQFYAAGLLAVLLAVGLGTLLAIVMPFWCWLPVGVVCGYVIGQAVMEEFISRLPSDE